VPGELAIYDRQSRQQHIITHTTRGCSRLHRGAWERFDVEPDGTIVEAWLLKPADFDPNRNTLV